MVAAPTAGVRANPTGTSALATAGSGDVLAGLCGALLAGGLDPFDAGSVGAWLHGRRGLAADAGPVLGGRHGRHLPAAVPAAGGAGDAGAWDPGPSRACSCGRPPAELAST